MPTTSLTQPTAGGRPTGADRPPLSDRCLGIASALSELAGIGPKRAALLAQHGLTTVADLLLAFPSRYLDWRQIKVIHDVLPGEVATVAGRLAALSERPMRGSRWRRLLTGWLQDGQGGRIRVVWFNAPPHLRQRFGAAAEAIVQGKVSRGADGRMEIVHPEVYLPGQDPPLALQPSYRAGEYIGQRLMRSAVDRALAAADELPAALPDQFRTQLQLPSLAQAVRYLHQPPPDADLEALQAGTTAAHQALAADELFAFELALEIDRELARARPGIAFNGGQRPCRSLHRRTAIRIDRGPAPRNRGNPRGHGGAGADEPPADGRCGQRQDRDCIVGDNQRGGARLSGRDDGADGVAGRAALRDLSASVRKIRRSGGAAARQAPRGAAPAGTGLAAGR